MRGARKKQQAAHTSVDYSVLAEYIERFPSRKIVLLGDFVADEFQSGEIARVSREAPVLILRHRESKLLPGGGANAANNLVDLGAHVLPVTAVGDDAAGDMLIEYFRAKRVNISGIVRVRGWTTPVKTRFLAGWAHTARQQVLRVDREPAAPPPQEVRARLEKKLREFLRRAHALAVCDYGFGAARPEAVRTVLSRTRNRLISALDSRRGLTAYAGAGITSATPNEPELEALHHAVIGQNLEELERCGRATLAEMKLSALLVTRGRDGMALFEPGKPTARIAIHGSDQAVDVTGAGDTVLAAYTLSLACGASHLEAAHIANIAGGLVVMKRGTATVRREELLAAVHREVTGS